MHAGHPDATPKGHRLHGRVTWNPFSNGPRNCIGQSLAMQELRTVLAIFLSKFKLELPGDFHMSSLQKPVLLLCC